MSKVTRKLLLSILSVVLTVIALGATTFAWFTITNVASVQAFDADMRANQGIEIALETDGLPSGGASQLNWVTNLTTAAILEYLSEVYNDETGYPEGFRFDHVTSVDGINFTTLYMDSEGEFAQQITNKGYIELPIHFRSDTVDKIDLTGLILSPKELYSWHPDVAFVSPYGSHTPSSGSISVDATNAMRVSFQSFRVIAVIEGENTAYEYSHDNVRVYEKPTVGNNTALGSGGDLSGVENKGAPGAMNYFYEKNGKLPLGVDAVVVPSTFRTTSTYNMATNEGDSQVILTLTDLANLSDGNEGTVNGTNFAGARYYGKVMIRIYVEGWDPEAYNAILGQRVEISFEFTGSNEEIE